MTDSMVQPGSADPSANLASCEPADAEANPNLRRFSNRLRILLGIDMYELVNAGAISSDDTASWTSFRDNPWRYFIKAGDAEQAAIWSIIERRETRTA